MWLKLHKDHGTDGSVYQALSCGKQTGTWSRLAPSGRPVVRLYLPRCYPGFPRLTPGPIPVRYAGRDSGASARPTEACTKYYALAETVHGAGSSLRVGRSSGSTCYGVAWCFHGLSLIHCAQNVPVVRAEPSRRNTDWHMQLSHIQPPLVATLLCMTVPLLETVLPEA